MEITVGAILEGNVKSITKFGAFVSLPGGRSGLVHISEIAHSYVNDVKDFLQEGQPVKVKVVGIDEAGRINLSIKKALPPPPRQQNHAPARNGPSGARPQTSASAERRTSSGGAASRKEPEGFFPGKVPVREGPADFEYRLKQFMQSSDSKLSGLRLNEKRSSRRSGHK